MDNLWEKGKREKNISLCNNNNEHTYYHSTTKSTTPNIYYIYIYILCSHYYVLLYIYYYCFLQSLLFDITDLYYIVEFLFEVLVIYKQT